MDLKKQAIRGIKWTTLSSVSLAITQLLKISVLARFLDKTDFGLMAIVMVVLGFTNLFVDMGLTSAILHKQNITKNQYASLYWINFVFSFVLFIVVWFISPFVASFYNQPELITLIPLMALTIVFSAFGRQFKVIEQKELNFRFISLVDIVGSILSLIFAIFLAYYGYGIYSLVYSVILLQIISNTAFLIKGIKRIGIKLHFALAETRPFLKIGIYQVGGQIINYFNRDLDILIIGKFFGTEILGSYSLAKQLVRRPLQIIDPVITKVGLGVFPKYQNDNKRLSELFSKVLTILGGINIVVYGTILLLAPYIVRLLYGNNFEDIIILVQLFTIIVYLRSLGGQAGVLVVTKGRTDVDFYWNIINLIIFPVFIYIGSQYSIIWVIINIAVMQIFMTIPAWFFFYKRLINMSFNMYIKPIVIPMLLSGIVLLLNFVVLNNTILSQVISTSILYIIIFIYLYNVSSEFKKIINEKLLNHARIYFKNRR